MTAKELNELRLHAWKMGIKSLYYVHGQNSAQQFLRNKPVCAACDG